MVFGTDEFVGAESIELIHHPVIGHAWSEYEGNSSCLLTELFYYTHPFLNMTYQELQEMLHNDNDREYLELKFMLACFVLLVAGEEI